MNADVTWAVQRHGGRRTDFWRQTFHGTEEAARKWYAIDYKNMRQGGVRLVRPDGAIELDAWAPRVRSRW
jgi:hypothetical protein